MNRDYDKIEEYIERTLDKELRLLISDFAILWNEYEKNIFNTCYCSRKLKSKIIDNVDYDDNFQQNINRLYLRFKKYLEDRKILFSTKSIINSYKIRNNDISPEELNKLIESSDDKDKLYLLLLIIARVRNNMFHGIKRLDQLTNQKELFKISNETLTLILSKTNYLVF